MERRLKFKDVTVRDYVAIQVLPILIATASDMETHEEICDEAVRIADMLMKKLNNEYIRRHRRNNL